MAPPVTPAISEWDFDAGMPRYQQKKPQPMDPIIAAIRAISAWCVLPEKLTMLNMVWATAVEIYVMPTRPTKLKMAARIRAVPGLRQRVETAEAMALGASVAPEITVTPITRTRMTISAG